MLSVVKLW